MEHRDIPARVVAEVCGVTPDYIRNWRSDGLLEGVGERVGVGTYYSRTEVLKMALAVELAKVGLGIKTAFDVAVSNPISEITAALLGQGGSTTFWPKRDAAPDHLADSVRIVVDAAALVGEANIRLDTALEKERRQIRPRRLSFGPSPTAIRYRA